MNKVERVVGASAFVAAAVVTVIVYDGRVSVENPKHERVVVAPGSTYVVEPPVEEKTVGVAAAKDVTTCDEVSCVLTDYEGACCARYKPTKDTLDKADIDGAVALMRADIAACGDVHPAAGKVVLTVRVADSKVDMVKVLSAPDAELGQCVADVMKTAVFPAANELVTFNMPFVFPAPKVACDASALKDKGMEQVNMGEHAKALALFEQSLACKRDSYVVALGFMAACNAQDTTKARLYYGELSPAQQSKYKVMCDRNHVDVSCDADALKDKGMDAVNASHYAAALAQFEASLRCKQDSYVVTLAFTAACSSQNAAKARFYYGQLTPAQQSKFKVMCIRNNIDLDSSCDADALKDSGMQKINEGSHAEALALFEESLACKPDPYVEQLAFMESCNSRNTPKARAYYAKLTPAQQSKYEVICKRNKVDVVDSSGYLQVFSKPAAKILIDGVDTGLTTPIKGKALALAPGKHKVTFVIGGDRYSFGVMTKAGQTDTMTKDLQ